MIENFEKMVSLITSEIKKEVNLAVIGLSGGADSTLVATLCTKALGKENVFGVHMPYNQNDVDTFNHKSQELATYLGIESITAPIHAGTDSILANISTSSYFKGNCNISKLTNGNTRARVRMTTLYAIASILSEKFPDKKVRVMNTCNLSETYIGYETKWGDGVGDFYPIAELFKSEVYQLLDYFKEQGVLNEEHIDRVPSPGLWEGHTDLDEIGYSYDEMETYIRHNENMRLKVSHTPIGVFKFDTELNEKVTSMYNKNLHKHSSPKIIELKGLRFNGDIIA